MKTQPSPEESLATWPEPAEFAPLQLPVAQDRELDARSFLGRATDITIQAIITSVKSEPVATAISLGLIIWGFTKSLFGFAVGIAIAVIVRRLAFGNKQLEGRGER
jgi:hypothetical protein